MELLIHNAEIYDGVQPKSFLGSVLVRGDKIAGVFRAEPEGYQGMRLDAEGRVLCPGFVDSHSHNDFYATLPDNHPYFAPMALQGITSMVAGNCGSSATGFWAETPHGLSLTSLFPPNPEYKKNATFAGFAAIADGSLPINMTCLAGHGTARASVRGPGKHSLSAAEFDQMEGILDTALQEGAAGISFGLMYDPGMYAPYEELVRVAKIAARHDKPITFHMRACSKISTSYPGLFGRAHNLRALDEALDIARDAGAKVHLSHIIFVGKRSWGTLDETVELIDRANDSGIDTSFDIYPCDFGASTINVILPSWYQGLSPADKKKAWTRLKLNAEIFGAKKLLGVDFHDLEITYAGEEYPQYIGKRVDEIAGELGMGSLQAYLHIIDQTNAKASIFMYQYMNEHTIDLLSRHERVSYMTDAWIKPEGAQNLAAYGAFPRFLRLSREGKAEELGRMICKMTDSPARRFGLKGRGRIQEGYFADLVVFDKAAIAETKVGDKPVGLPHVLINGQFAVRDGEYMNAQAGKMTRV